MATGILATDLMSVAMSTQKKAPRSLYKVIKSSHSKMGKMTLKNVIEGNDQNYVSPFFLIDEFGPMQLPKSAQFRVDAHPHAGIIPTTYLLKGNAHHRDSMGNDYQYHEGDFIQFTSGRGALHMEETGDDLYKNGGVFQGMQCWLNIPSHLKKSNPSASYLKKEDIELVISANVTIRVILGEVYGVKSPVKLLMPVIYWHISLKENTCLDLPVDPTQNAFIYLLTGSLEVSDRQEVNAGEAVLFERDGDFITIRPKQEADFLVLGGAVNNEPYVANGPFVLNNELELRQAYEDFKNGKFGNIAETNGMKRP
jgi:redox-sensitive bicupin YhaK (pirin superfamily)